MSTLEPQKTAALPAPDVDSSQGACGPAGRFDGAVAGLVGGLRVLAFAGLLLSAGGAHALDFGPFTLTGFVKGELTRVSDYCPDCQLEPNESKHRFWADELVQGKEYGAGTTDVWLFQPFLAFNHDLPRGFRLHALLSQRWRDGRPDLPGVLYERNAAISHEDYGRLSIGAFPTRAWSFADYPFGSSTGVSDAWSASGAGYGLLTRAVRYTSRLFDVFEGDLTVEVTHDIGKKGWKQNKPRFWEVWVQYINGDLSMNFMWQDARNGTPSAFGKGPFTSLTPFVQDDGKVGSSGQSIAMLMAHYRVGPQLEVSGGIRGNRWSGAYAVITQPGVDGGFDLWNEMFNVDWSRDLGGGVYRGYPATSVDFTLGLRYSFGDWVASTGMVHLGAAATANPSERGQSNSATINVVGLTYKVRRGVEVYGYAGMVNYSRKGLSPMSAPDNKTFTNIDSRLTTRGNWVGVGATYTF
jgi:predicted porin